MALSTGENSRMCIRLERWSARPREDDQSGQERDELPWQEVLDGGLLRVGAEQQDGLDVTGLGRARVSVRVATRAVADDEVQEWLLRFFPDPDRQDAMAGPPRVISHDRLTPLAAGTTTVADPFVVGLERIAAGGWSWMPTDILNIGDLLAALRLGAHSLTPDEILRWLTLSPMAYTDGWETSVAGWSAKPNLVFVNDANGLIAALEDAAGMPAICTLNDSLQCLLNLGVLTRTQTVDGNTVIAPSPDAPAVWQALEVSQGWRVHLRSPALRKELASIEGDVEHLLFWAPDGELSATPRQIAERLGLAIGQARGCLELLAADQDVDNVDDDTPVHGRSRAWREPTGVPVVARMNHDDLVSLANEFLAPSEVAQWLAYERPSARLVRAEPGGEAAAVLGGLPQLPSDVDWPMLGDEPLRFLANLNLAAVHKVLPSAPLPPDGSLLFFATYDSEGPGGDTVMFVAASIPASRPGWRVLYVPAGFETAERLCPPHPNLDVFDAFGRVECGLVLDATLPEPSAYARARKLELDDERMAAFRQAKWQRFDRWAGSNHRVGGWADPAQDEPAWAVALAQAGVTNAAKSTLNFDHPSAKALAETADDDWFLLLQLAEDGGPGWMWGDGGVMFFYVQPEAARVGGFSDAWMNWDCH
ncbi:MAG: DUF1963 domain-containing protein [Actinomycetia bacterium]|nr:DUF1963 domain-containing protein [Actinomycetes bacterium]